MKLSYSFRIRSTSILYKYTSLNTHYNKLGLAARLVSFKPNPNMNTTLTPYNPFSD